MESDIGSHQLDSILRSVPPESANSLPGCFSTGFPKWFRPAACNEVFEQTPLEEVCRTLRGLGYRGIEIAPFTLSEDPLDLSADRRRELRGLIQTEGLRCVGLHWLMVSPKGLHVTTADATLRLRSWQHIRNLIDLCADLTDGGVMIFGSPKQRGTSPGVDPKLAVRHFVDGLSSVAHHAMGRGVTILVEALPKSQCDVINTLAVAEEVVREIGSPSVQTMFDVHNAEDEIAADDVLIREHFHQIRHVHVNEMDGRHPGTADHDFLPLLRALRDLDYRGWVSLEAFDFSLGGERIARESLNFLASQLRLLDQAPLPQNG